MVNKYSKRTRIVLKVKGKHVYNDCTEVIIIGREIITIKNKSGKFIGWSLYYIEDSKKGDSYCTEKSIKII